MHRRGAITELPSDFLKELVSSLEKESGEESSHDAGGSPLWADSLVTLDDSNQSTLAKTIMDSWFGERDRPQPISEAESLLEQGQLQAALAHLGTHIRTTDSPPSQYINAIILRACALRVYDPAAHGLEFAETALGIASRSGLEDLICNAQLHRGLCLFDLGRYADASFCFTKAASIRWFARDVTRLTKESERKRTALPEGAKGKRRSKDFEEIPSTTFCSSWAFPVVPKECWGRDLWRSAVWLLAMSCGNDI
jgi:tetratricopeptide (TPR) repeat protein